MSVYHDAVARMQEEWAKQMNDAVWASVLAHAASPAHSLPRCKTCSGTRVVLNGQVDANGQIIMSCPDCSLEPFPLS